MSKQTRSDIKAPAFSAQTISGDYPSVAIIKLSGLISETVVLSFYPKEDTLGCITQACALCDGWQEISPKAKLFGISIDPIKSHEKFIGKHDLPFPIQSDEDHRIADAYDVWVGKSMYG